MLYYPKSHITPNLFSSGEMAYKDGSPYKGSYFTTLDGKVFSGKYPGDGDNIELKPYSPTPYSTPEDFESNVEEDSRFYPENIDYTDLNPSIEYNQNLTPPPVPFYPQPSEQDYKLGEFTRYFSKKTNENKYTETSGLFQNNLYIGFKLPWLISGDKDEVARVNENIVKLREQELGITGFGFYLKNNYLKFYK